MRSGAKPTRHLGLPVLSALLLFPAHPPFALPALAFIGLAPLGLRLADASPDAAGRARTARAFALFGALYFGLALYWMPATLFRFSPWAIPGYLVVVGLLALILWAAGWVGHVGVHRFGLPVWIVLPVVWTAGEWTRAHAPGTLAFPWLGLGVALAPLPQWAGIAEIVGERGVGFWMAGVGGLVASARSHGGDGWRGWSPAVLLAACAVVLVPGLWGVWRAETLESRPVARVAMVQPDISAELRRDAEAGWNATRRSLEELLAGVESGSVDLVVLPEVTVRAVVEPASPPDAVTRPLARIAETLKAPVLFGAFGAGPGPKADRGAVRYNSAFLMRTGGVAAYRYDKRKLVPVVERVPLRLPSWLGLDPGGEFAAGGEGPLLRVAGVRFGLLICYESIFAGPARHDRAEGAQLLVNITNDAWFGGEPWWARTPAFWQHPAHLVLRAIENRMGAVRVANTGISMLVDPVGRTREVTSLFRPELRIGEVFTSDARTLYTRYGDVVGTASILMALVLGAGGLAGWGGRATRGSFPVRRSLDPPPREH